MCSHSARWQGQYTFTEKLQVVPSSIPTGRLHCKSNADLLPPRPRPRLRLLIHTHTHTHTHTYIYTYMYILLKPGPGLPERSIPLDTTRLCFAFFLPAAERFPTEPIQASPCYTHHHLSRIAPPLPRIPHPESRLLAGRKKRAITLHWPNKHTFYDQIGVEHTAAHCSTLSSSSSSSSSFPPICRPSQMD